MGLGGLEPPTSRLSSARSNQLSYKPLAELSRMSAVQSRSSGATARRGSCRALAERLAEAVAARERRLKSFAKKEKRRRQAPLQFEAMPG